MCNHCKLKELEKKHGKKNVKTEPGKAAWDGWFAVIVNGQRIAFMQTITKVCAC